MSKLTAILIDVGWGDSILIEHEDKSGEKYFGLIDSNDSVNLKSTFVFVKRYFEKNNINISNKPVFKFIILSHDHSDHAEGLKNIMQNYGTEYFFYPKVAQKKTFIGNLIKFSNLSSNVKKHEALNKDKIFPAFGDTKIKILWPEKNYHLKEEDPNLNSIVLSITLGKVSFLLTGDAETKVWHQISTSIPESTQFFKIPHHGSRNGMFDNNTLNPLPWFDSIKKNAPVIGISCHCVPRNFNHPHKEVINFLDSNGANYFRTDLHYHIFVETDGIKIGAKYTH